MACRAPPGRPYAPGVEPRAVAIVPHTHWDREWYEPFQAFRLRLVELFDGLLQLLDDDLSYSRFLLDGQTVVLDDYLAVRPEQAATITRLVTNGRVSIGPWQCLMDEYMVSGETLVRNLQRGIARAATFGGAMPVGYLPDMFGHVAQMPQLLRLAGFGHAVLWRGVPARIDRNAFWWESPDGSRVRTEHLYGSYSNGRDLPDDPADLVRRVRAYEAELGPGLLPGAGILLMNGTDHHLPQPGLGRVVAAANDLQDEYRLAITSLPEFLAAQPTDGLPVWCGELRSGALTNVLMGVASNRVDVHQACATAERALERVAEPLCTLFAAPGELPEAVLDAAWELLVLNSAHDSACACSHDDVVLAVVQRYQEARHAAEAMAGRAVRAFAARVDTAPASTVVCNPTPATRGGVVVVDTIGDAPVHFVADDGVPCATQDLGPVPSDGLHAVVVGEKVRWICNLARGHEFAGTPAARFDRTQLPDGTVEYVVTGAAPGEPTIDVEDLRTSLLTDGTRGATVRVRQALPETRRIAVAVPPVPGFGWRTLRPVDGYGPGTALAAGPNALANAHLRVDVDPTDGTLTLTTADGVVVRRAGRLVDGGDGGDTYNYSPPALDHLVETPESVEVRVTETGPVRARVEITAQYRWPTHAVGDRLACSARAESTSVTEVRSTVELRHDERFVRVRTELDHHTRDHRLRVHVPLPTPVDGSDAECAFAVVHRGLDAEGGPHEVGLPTFVSRRFVDCSDGAVGVTLLHDGLLEYEIVGGGTELALTLVRATGYLSRAEPALRPNPAGPLLPTPAAQVPGTLTLEYAILPHRGSWIDADPFGAADEFLVPLAHAPAGRASGPSAGTGRAPAFGRHLAVDGAAVSAVTRTPDGTVVRCFNPRPHPTELTLTRGDAPVSGWEVDLLGRPVRLFPGTRTLGPAEIVTLRLD